jgi:hypothetical protein
LFRADNDAALQRLQGDLDSALAEKKKLAADLEAQRKKNNVSAFAVCRR